MRGKKILLAILLLFIFNSFAQSQDNSQKLKQKISTSFVNTPLERAVRILAQQYNLNIIVSGQVKGNITTNLNDVPLGDALNAILKSQGYHYIYGDNMLIVKPQALNVNGELETQIFRLKYVDGFSLKTAITPLLSPKGKIEALLAEPEANDKLIRSNILVVTDLWENIKQIIHVISQMDRPEKQLQIEVRLVEKIIGNDKNVGLDLPKKATVSLMGAETTAPISNTSASQGGATTILSAWYNIPSNVENLSLGVLTLDNLRATLNLLAQDVNSHLLARPSVTVMNNRKAIIKMGSTIPVPEISRSVAGDLFSYKDKDVSMTVEVIPHIGENNDITLNVHPVLEEITGYTGSSAAPQPITSRREVKTTVRLKDGETLVIGGLIKENKREIKSKVWLLGDIPILGYLFKSTSVKNEKSNLIIFITTKIFDQKSKKGKN